MTILLVIGTFLVFALIDFLMSKRPAVQTAPVSPQPAVPSEVIDGFQVPTHVRYHPGHGWLLRERKNRARVGADAFAAAVAGTVDRIELPRPGQWLRQGQKAWTFYRDGQPVDMVSPTEGEVVEVNAALLEDPTLLRRDPYGEGWIAIVQVPDEETTGRNLLPFDLVATWMHDAVMQVAKRRKENGLDVPADPVSLREDLMSGMPGQSQTQLARQALLTSRS